jgi:trans-aconitate methyltransferase
LIFYNVVVYGSEQQVVPKDWNAQAYKDASFLQFAIGMKVIEKIQWQGNEAVLEIGCGDGKITHEIAKLVPQGSVHGIHVSPNLITYCCQTYAGHKNMSFEQTDLANFVAARKFNKVVSFASLDWEKNKEQAFANIAQACAPDAYVHLSVTNQDNPYLKARFAMLTSDKWKQFFEGYVIPFFPYTEQSLRTYIYNAGLRTTALRKEKQTHIFLTREDFIKWLFVVPVQYERIPEDRQVEFFNDMIDLYLQDVPADENGAITLVYDRIRATAKQED